MPRESNPHNIQFQDHERQAHKLAVVLMRRAHMKGQSDVTLNDCFSDVCWTFVQCVRNFDPTKGAQFPTYFQRSVMRNASGALRRRAIERKEMPTTSLDDATWRGDDDNTSSLADRIADTSVNVAHTVEQREQLRRLAGKTPLAVRVLELILEPPEDLQAEIAASAAQAEWAKTLGVGADAPEPALSVVALQRIFGFNWRQRQVLQQELQRAAELVG